MADNVEMQGIEFQIVNDSAAASAGVEVLAKKLTELKTSISGSTTALSKVAAGISQIKNAVNNMNTGDFANKMNRISTSLSNLKAQTDSLKISASIGNQLAAINQAITNLPDTPGEKLRNLASGLQPLSELGRSNMTSFINQLKKLPEVITDLEKADIDKFTQQMKDLASAMKPFADEMNKVSSGFSAFPSRIQRLITSTEQYNGTVKRATTSTNAWNSALKAISFAAIYRAAAKRLGIAIAKSSQYTEDLNLFTVSMGKYAEEAYNYAQKVSEVMGIDPAEWMRNQGVFNTIITGFGVAGDKAAFMSKNLTQLGYDLASFYNIDFASAMQKVQSGISGELEPLRRLGYDLSVARLEQERLNLGIDKSVSSMTQAEKSQLRYYAMMTQVTQVQGDMARTLENPANMLRVLRAELEQAARAVGNIFIPILTKVLPIAIAVASALREIIAAIAALFGVTVKSPKWGDAIGSASAGSGAIADNMDSAAGSAKELKRYLAGFDELNVLPDQNQGGSGSGAGGGGGDLGLDLPGYDFLKNAVSDKIDEWKKKLEPFVSFIKDNLKEILELAGTIGAALLAWKLSTDLLNGISAIKSMAQSGLSIPLTIATGAILTTTGFKIEISGIRDAIEQKLNALNFGEIVAGGLLGTAGAGILGKGIGQFITKAFGESAVSKAITAGGGTISTGLIGAAIGGIVAGIPMFVTGVYDAIVNGLNVLNGLLIPTGSTLAGAGVGAIIGSLGGPIGTGIGALIGLAVGALTDLGILIYQKWDEICAFFAPVAEWFNVNVIQPISGFFSGLWDGIVNTFSPAISWFSDLWGSVSQTFEDVFYDIGVLASGTWETIKIIWGIVSDWFDTNVIQPVASFFSGLWDGISSWAIESWNKISTVFSGIAVWFDTNVIRPIVGFFTDLWSDITVIFGEVVGFFKGIINGVLSGLNSAIRYAFGGINSILRSIRGFSIAGFTPFSGLREISVPKIPLLADGGFVDQGQLFIAREAGAELVGSIGRRTAVANNDQIVEGITYGVREANDDVVTAIYAVAQQIISEMRSQDGGSGGGYDFDRAVASAQRRNARMYG
nr:MAG TPA: minor tail protein [Caudoviricetes sp.]